jgi:hypothetical protein
MIVRTANDCQYCEPLLKHSVQIWRNNNTQMGLGLCGNNLESDPGSNDLKDEKLCTETDRTGNSKRSCENAEEFNEMIESIRSTVQWSIAASTEKVRKLEQCKQVIRSRESSLQQWPQIERSSRAEDTLGDGRCHRIEHK